MSAKECERVQNSENYYEDKDIWLMSPAYDLTYSSTYYGEHTTSVNGNGINPSIEDMIKVAEKNGLNKRKADVIIDEVSHKVKEMLDNYTKI